MLPTDAPALIQLKETLCRLCEVSIDENIRTLEEAIHHAQAAANEETKSSVGDKYETGRAMMQLEIESLSGRLAVARKTKAHLLKIDLKHHSTIQEGSLAATNHGTFFLAINGGIFTVDDNAITVVSSASPLGQQLTGKKVADTFQLNGRLFEIMALG